MYNNVSGGREQIESLSGLTSTKIIVGVLVFTVSVFLLNGLFYNKVKKALHQRKIIWLKRKYDTQYYIEIE